MSTQPIGTLFPSVAPNALVRVGVPSANGFSMTEGVVSVESLIPTSGTWIPEVSNVAGTATINVADNVSRLGEVAEHKTSLELQMFKLKIECQTKH